MADWPAAAFLPEGLNSGQVTKKREYLYDLFMSVGNGRRAQSSDLQEETFEP